VIPEASGGVQTSDDYQAELQRFGIIGKDLQRQCNILSRLSHWNIKSHRESLQPPDLLDVDGTASTLAKKDFNFSGSGHEQVPENGRDGVVEWDERIYNGKNWRFQRRLHQDVYRNGFPMRCVLRCNADMRGVRPEKATSDIGKSLIGLTAIDKGRAIKIFVFKRLPVSAPSISICHRDGLIRTINDHDPDHDRA